MICQIKNTKVASRKQLNDIFIFDRKMLSSKYDGLFIYNNYQNPFSLLN